MTLAIDRLRIAREGQWSDSQDQQHPRGTGTQGGQFVAKGKSTAGPAPKPAVRIFGASDKVAAEIAEARARHAQKTKKKARPGRPSPTMPTAAQPSHSFRPGDTGKGVGQLQALMGSLGFTTDEDGKYGTQTEQAVRAMQEKLGMAQTGRASARLIRRMQDAKALSPCVKESIGPAAALFRRVREAANFDDVLHPRDSEGKFRTVFDRVNRALTDWAKGEGPDHPIEALHLSRPSLMRVSKKMGVTPRRGAPDSEIEDGILAKAREIDRGRRDGEKGAKAAAPATAADRVRAARPKMTPDEMVGNLEIMHGDALREHAKRAGVDTSGPDADVRDRIRAKATEVLMGEPRKRLAPAPETPSIMQPSDGPALYNPDGGGWGAIAGAWLGVDKGKSGPAPVPSGPVKLSAAEKERRRKILAAPVSEPTVLRPEHGIGVFSQDLGVSAQAASKLDAAAGPATAAAKVRAAKAIRRDLLREQGIDAHYQPAGVVRAAGEADRRLARGDSPAEVAQYLRQSAQSLNPADDDQTSKTLMDPATLRERHRLGKKTLRDLAASVAKERSAAAKAVAAKKAAPRKAAVKAAPHPDFAGNRVNAAKAREKLAAAKTPDERRAYLESLGMTKTQANALAKAVGAKQAEDPARTIDNIVGHFDTSPTPHGSAPAPRKAAVKAARATPTDAAEGLRLASTREEGHALLQDASVADLKEIARLSGVHLRPGATKAQIRDEIVQTRVGARVSSAAIRGERVVPGPKVEPLPTAAAKAAAKDAPRTGGAALASLPIRDTETLSARTTKKVDTGVGFEVDEPIDVAGVPGGRIQDAVADYESNGYEFVNKALRIADGDVSAVSERPPPGVIAPHYSAQRVHDQVEGIDAAMSVSRTSAPIVVHRGVGSGDAIFGSNPPGDLVGREWTDHGYVSTSVDERAARRFADSGAGIRMAIHVPAGVGAVGIENSQPGLKSEREVLLQRGLRFRVTGDRTVRGERHIDVEVVPARPAPAAAKVRAVKAAKATPAKGALKGPFTVADAQDLAEEITANGYSEREIIDRLTGLNIAELRKYATAQNVQVPADFSRGPAGTVATKRKLTADELRRHIAASIVADRGRYTWR